MTTIDTWEARRVAENARIIAGMIGKTYATVSGKKGDDVMRFLDADGRGVEFFHDQDCCETVEIDDVCGDITDLIGAPITLAEAVSNVEHEDKERDHSCTWTFYRFATAKGLVTVRWYGTSNGYYSECVDVRAVIE